MRRPAIADCAFAGRTQTFTIVDSKIVITIGHSNLFAFFNVTSSHDRHALIAASHQTTIGIAVVVGEACGAQKERRGLAAAGHHNAEVLAGQAQVELLFLGHGNERAAQVFDLLARFDGLASTDGCFVFSDNVSVGRSHLEWALGEVDLDVFAQVSTEPLLLARGAQVGKVFLQTRQFQQFALGFGQILGDYHIVEEDAANIVVVDSAGRAVFRTVLARRGPKVSLWT